MTVGRVGRTWDAHIHSRGSLFVTLTASRSSDFDAALNNSVCGPVNKHRPDWDPKGFAKAKEELRSDQPSKDGHYVKPFRCAIGFNHF
jgi:hypothetical protein